MPDVYHVIDMVFGENEMKNVKKLVYVGISIALVVLTIIFALVAYDYVFEGDWSERPASVFYDSNGKLQVLTSVHSHKRHERFRDELRELAKDAGANDDRVQSLYKWEQIKSEIDMKVRPIGHLCTGLAVVSFLLSIGFFYYGFFGWRRRPVVSTAETKSELGQKSFAEKKKMIGAHTKERFKGLKTRLVGLLCLVVGVLIFSVARNLPEGMPFGLLKWAFDLASIYLVVFVSLKKIIKGI